MGMKVNIGGSWKDVTDIWVNIGGSWKVVTRIQTNIATAWKEAFAVISLACSINTSNAFRIRFNNTCTSGVSYAANGIEYKRRNTGTWNFTSRGNWLDEGDADDVWVQVTVNSGSLNSGNPGSGRLQLTVDRQYGVIRTSVGSHNANVSVTMWDAASGGNILDGPTTFDITAEYTL